jgi:hypothetical protein
MLNIGTEVMGVMGVMGVIITTAAVAPPGRP